MKKLKISILAVTVVAVTVGIIYTISSRRLNAGSAPPSTYDQQVSFLEGRIQKYPEDYKAYAKLAYALMARAEATGGGADYDRALAELAKAEKVEPGNQELLLVRAVVLLSRHRFAESRAAAEEGLKGAPDSPDFIGVAGDGALQTGDLGAAEQYYRRLTELEPKKASSWSRLSQLAELRGDLNEAAALMEKAINVSYPRPLSPSGFAWARAILGEIELKRGNAVEARRQYMWALDKYPGHLVALQHLAELDESEGRLAEAEAGYREVLKQQRQSPEANLGLSRLMEKRGERTEAAALRAEVLRFYEAAVESGNEGFLRQLAEEYLKDGRYEKAAALAERDLKLRPTAESRLFHEKVLQAARDKQTAAR